MIVMMGNNHFFFLSFFRGEFLGYFEVLPSWTGWRFVRSRSCNDPCRRMTLLLPPANKRKKWKNITTCRNIIIKRFCYCGHCRSWHTKDKFKKKDTKNESVSFCVCFFFFLFNPLRAWNENEQQGKHTQKKEEEDERDVLSCNNHTNTINAKVNNRKQHWVHMLLSNQPKEKKSTKEKSRLHNLKKI
jgi:hypothetical protein